MSVRRRRLIEVSLMGSSYIKYPCRVNGKLNWYGWTGGLTEAFNTGLRFLDRPRAHSVSDDIEYPCPAISWEYVCPYTGERWEVVTDKVIALGAGVLDSRKPPKDILAAVLERCYKVSEK